MQQGFRKWKINSDTSLFYGAFNLMLNKNRVVKFQAFTGFKGTELIDKIIDIDQSPIGRTPRSNPATYTGAFGLGSGLLDYQVKS